MKERILNKIGIDGFLHILISLMIVRISAHVMPLWMAVVLAAIIGAGKEFIWDKWLKKGTFDKKDLVCDLAGILIGCI